MAQERWAFAHEEPNHTGVPRPQEIAPPQDHLRSLGIQCRATVGSYGGGVSYERGTPVWLGSS